MQMDNFIKGPLTSLMGLVLMCVSFYGWWLDGWTEWESSIVGIIGFSLLWMRDKIPTYIERFVTAVLDKFGIQKPKDNEPK